VVTLRDHGLTRQTVAAVFGVSVRTISRIDARWRARTTPQSLAQLLDLPPLDQVLAGPRPPRPRGRRSRIKWRSAAARLEVHDS
jgi:hypothetical protein